MIAAVVAVVAVVAIAIGCAAWYAIESARETERRAFARRRFRDE